MKLNEVVKSIDDTIEEWESKTRSMGCVAAAAWFCKTHKNFKPIRKRFYMEGGTNKNGKFWEHVVVTDGIIEIDISPYANKPK
jgi:hypothetical protein